MEDIDDEWSRYLNDEDIDFSTKNNLDNENDMNSEEAPECEELYISTMTKVLFLNTPIDINSIFWKLPVINYSEPKSGIVKKQMKIVSKTEEEYQKYKEKLKDITYYKEHIIKQIDNPSARRIKFKDERKITVGISKKDIMNCRGKIKNAFYNCFAIIIRFMYNGSFKEVHIKVFNTGKLEIPGVLNDILLDEVKNYLLMFIQPLINKKLEFVQGKIEQNVLINSNFKCGYYINRDKFYKILKGDKYRLETSYDPSSYPGIKCKFYFNNDKGYDKDIQKGLIDEEDRNMKLSELDDNKKYTEISFMIFRTGSCLIVGNCTENILRFVYEFIRDILKNEFINIKTPSDSEEIKEKKEKQRKKIISVSKDYFNQLIKT
tara:strand:+ start:32 stop:1159 length:1128 start_codon:yes stop_codon:yes gene_type:complete